MTDEDQVTELLLNWRRGGKVLSGFRAWMEQKVCVEDQPQGSFGWEVSLPESGGSPARQ